MAKGATVNYSGSGGWRTTDRRAHADDQDVFVYRMRVHRDIVP